MTVSKFKDVKSLISALDGWVDRRVKSIEKRLLLIDAPDIPVGQKELEVKILAAVVAEIEGYLRDVMDVGTDDPNHPLQYAKDTIDLILSEIQEDKDLPVEEDVSAEEPVSQKETPLEHTLSAECLNQWADEYTKYLKKCLENLEKSPLPLETRGYQLQLIAHQRTMMEALLHSIEGEPYSKMLDDLYDYIGYLWEVLDKEKNEGPKPREATEVELAFVREVNKLQEEVDVLVAYKAGTPALKKAQDRAVLLKRLAPALEEDTPSEIPPIYDILPSTCTKIEKAIREQSKSYGSL
ncbi:hypothetical protein BSP10_073 [Bacillus phage BSP10]|nr:hypothetical protein BSP10_073 [Bacillus phage BSP10]QRI44696.1 RNA-splicing ligase [Bacillus phage BSTP3]